LFEGGSTIRGSTGPVEPIGVEQSRWDRPFGLTPIEPIVLSAILDSPIFADVDPADFPADLPLNDIIANDGRIRRFECSERIYGEQEFGNSLFVVLRGHVRCELIAGGRKSERVGLPEDTVSWSQAIADFDRLRGNVRAFVASALKAIRPALDMQHEQRGFIVNKDEQFGVVGVLRRRQRGESAYAGEDDTLVLELRWSGIRDLRFWSDTLCKRMDQAYRRQCRLTALRGCPLFDGADYHQLEVIAENTVFESYGEMDWSHRFQRSAAFDSQSVSPEDIEPVISDQGERSDGLLVINSGLIRVSHKIDQAELTVGFLTTGDAFGLDGLIADLNSVARTCADYTLRACGYADVLWIPIFVIETWLEIDLSKSSLLNRQPAAGAVARGEELPQSLLDFIVDNRFINATSAMVINTDRCVNCDDCVRACATTHGDVPRFVRQGKTHHNLMVTNACMHCIDPVCMIDCPSDAIERDAASGNVTIKSEQCIGCGACANACPYGNIRMGAYAAPGGDVISFESGTATLKAIKCDLCIGLPGGPACKRACPHDAIERINIGDAATLSDWLQAALK